MEITPRFTVPRTEALLAPFHSTILPCSELSSLSMPYYPRILGS